MSNKADTGEFSDQCECCVDYSEEGITGTITQMTYQGNGIYECPKCHSKLDYSDSTYIVTLKLFKVKCKTWRGEEEIIDFKSIQLDPKLNEMAEDTGGHKTTTPLSECFLESIAEEENLFKDHEEGTFKFEIAWYDYRTCWEYDERECVTVIMKEEKIK